MKMALSVTLLVLLGCAQSPLEGNCPQSPLRENAARQGGVRVIATLDIPHQPEPEGQPDQAQRQRIAEAQDRLIGELNGMEVTVVRKYERLPQIALRVDEPALCHLLTSPLVRSVSEDSADAPASQ